MSAFKQAGWGEKDKEYSIMHERRLLQTGLGISILQSRPSGATEAKCRSCSGVFRHSLGTAGSIQRERAGIKNQEAV